MADSLFRVVYRPEDSLQFDRKKLRPAFVQIGKQHMRVARSMLRSRKASSAGANPARQTGALAKSIGYMIPKSTSRRPGLMVRIAPTGSKTGKVRGGKPIPAKNGRDDFYPAILESGVRKGAKRGKSHKKGASGGASWRIAPRNNYMIQTLEKEKPQTRYVLLKALRNAVKPAKGGA